MNSLVIQTPTHAISSERSIRRVFLSYSHDDFELAATFVKYFKPVARRLGVDFFYDADRLRAGYRWEETLLRELRQSQLLIFLVSINSIDEDGYCMGTELRFAAEHGFPIVPVVLSECPWRDPPIPGDPHGATLDQWQVLPLRNGDIVPVTHWENRADQAWSTVVEGLREILEEDAPGPALVLPHRPAAAGRPPVDVKLLPYLCDQQPWLDGFDGGLLTWDERALVVLVKGQYRDNPPLFWERLRLEHLSAFVSRHPERGLHLTLDVPLTLPVDGRASLENAKRALLWELSQQLTGNRFDIKDGATLAEHLGQQDGTIALLAFPATNPAPALGTAIEALLVLLDEIGTGDVLRRLVVAVTLEDPALSELSLVDEWKLNRFARSMVVELGPLDPISAHHARVWYHRRQIFETFGVEDTRIDALFSATPQMRMLDFDKSVQPLLNPASNQP